MVVGLLAATPAAAQFNEIKGETFLKAVREADGNKAMSLLDANGSTVLSYRGTGGETALNITAKRRDSTWLSFLISRGADANAGDSRGETPLLIASRIGWTDGVSLLIDRGAKIDGSNRLGETPLIVAVQGRQAPIVRTLLERGADPDRRDRAAGYSARDYARRDNRSTEISKLIESVKPTSKIKAGPILR